MLNLWIMLKLRRSKQIESGLIFHSASLQSTLFAKMLSPVPEGTCSQLFTINFGNVEGMSVESV